MGGSIETGLLKNIMATVLFRDDVGNWGMRLGDISKATVIGRRSTNNIKAARSSGGEFGTSKGNHPP